MTGKDKKDPYLKGTCDCMNKCCVKARLDLEKARDHCGRMVVHEAYSPGLFHSAQNRCQEILAHLRYCPHQK